MLLLGLRIEWAEFVFQYLWQSRKILIMFLNVAAFSKVNKRFGCGLKRSWTPEGQPVYFINRPIVVRSHFVNDLKSPRAVLVNNINSGRTSVRWVQRLYMETRITFLTQTLDICFLDNRALHRWANELQLFSVMIIIRHFNVSLAQSTTQNSTV